MEKEALSVNAHKDNSSPGATSPLLVDASYLKHHRSVQGETGQGNHPEAAGASYALGVDDNPNGLNPE